MRKKMDDQMNRIHGIRKLAVGYARVSTVDQGANGVSLDAQKAGIETFANAMDYTLIEIFEDSASGVGANSFRKRDGLTAALDLAAREDADLIAWEWDRLSRHAEFARQVRKVLPDSDRIICAKNGNSMLDASRDATFAHSEKMAAEISRTTKEGMAKRRADGAVFGNPDILTTVQPLGVTRSNSADDLVRKIADVLRDLDDPFKITYAEIA